MNNDPLISIIMPVYNVEKYIRRSLDCVVNQTYTNLEIILVDDGSQDNCPAICDEYAEKDSRIKVIHKQNGGIGSARNAGMDIATGDYLTIFDPDDYVSLEVCQKLVSACIKYHADMVVFNYKRIDEDGNTVEKINRCSQISLPEQVTEWTCNKFFEMVVSIDSVICGYTWNKLIKRDKIRGMKYVEEKIPSEDLLFMQQLSVRLDKILYIPDELYFYVVHPNSASNLMSESDVTELVIRDEIMKTAKMHFPELMNVCLYSLVDISFRIIKTVRNNHNSVKKCSKIMRKYIRDVSCCPEIPNKQKILYSICAILPKLYFIIIKK
ncbi:MAG: glycosyltransferase family 2 protein [Ruminococcaceae bacterium]|nr:glycosyltransferase family 2 protein [Oscillospiraceae bacterium]